MKDILVTDEDSTQEWDDTPTTANILLNLQDQKKLFKSVLQWQKQVFVY